MDLGLRDRVALVAGASRGIGFATAQAFLAEGCRIAITGRDEARLDEARAILATDHDDDRILAVAGDLCDPGGIDAALTAIEERWGQLDCVVANIGSGRGGVGWDLDDSEWGRLLEQNLACTYRLVQRALREMVRSRRGSIVLVASIAGREATAAPLPYSAAKAALISYGKNLARQLGPSEVRINVVAPGNILFPGGSWERHLSERRDEVLRQIDAEVPLGRFGKPEEVADVIVFLSSDRAAFITGSCVVVDGGQTRSA